MPTAVASWPDKLQMMTEHALQYCRDCGLSMNFAKIKATIFTRRWNKEKLSLVVNGHKIEQVNFFIYLGILLDKNGSWKLAQNKLETQVSKAIYQMKS